MTDRQNYLTKISEIPDFLAEKPGTVFPNGKRFDFPDLNQSNYNFSYHIFPSDLGMDSNGHYAVFNINVPTGITGASAVGKFTDAFSTIEVRSKVDQLRSGTFAGGGDAGVGANRPTAYIPRATKRIAESIAVFMPTPIVYNTHNVYEEISLTALAGKLGVGVQAAAGAFAGYFGGAISGSILSTIANASGGVLGGVAKIAQAPINPMVEILFSTTAVRQFTMELLLAPRNEVESNAARNIVRTLRFHAAPEYGENIGLTWIPPAEFDITFFNKGVENPNLLRINTCVLERIEVDYAPASGVYSTFRNGHPVAIRLSLGFRELEPIHKKRVLQGF